MAAILVPTSVATIIDPAVTAPVVGNTFCFQPDASGTDFTVVFQPTGTVTTLAAALQISLDGGVTFSDFIVTASFFPSQTTLFKTVTPMIAGALFRINYTTASGSIVMRVVSN
jgi:hypothetical protein